MKALLSQTAAILLHLGGMGLLILGVLDSSFLVMPLGNDLLVVALTAQHHTRMPYYALMASVGSVLGCLIMDAIGRKGGEEGLEKHVPKNRLEYVRRKVKARAGWTLAFASLMPPPFPFTPFVAAAAAFQYPRRKLLGIIGIARLIRFSIEGALAIYFGRRILDLAKSPAVHYGIVALVIISIGASVVSVLRWITRARRMSPGAVQKAGS